MSAVVINVLRKLDIDDLRKKTKAGGPSLSLRVRDWWFDRGKKMYVTKGAYTGTPWMPYNMARGGERRYVAIKYSIYKRAGGMFGREKDLLRWMAGGELLYPSLTEPKNVNAIYRGNRKSVNVGSSLPYVRSLSSGGMIPERLGGGTYAGRSLLSFGGQAKRDLDKVGVKWAKEQEMALDDIFSRNIFYL